MSSHYNFLLCGLFFLTILFLYITPVYSANPPNQCVPLRDFNVNSAADLFSGLNRPVCYKYLQEAGVTQVWYEQNKQSYENLPVEQQSLSDLQFLDALDAEKVTHLFTETQPSQLCQRTLVSVLCFHDNLGCDASGTKPNKKPCKWICNLLSGNSICTDSDKAYLKGRGFDLDSKTFKTLDCDAQDGNEWTDTDCWSPSHLSPHVPNARCETYRGDMCRGLYGSTGMVHIPNHSTQDEMEEMLSSKLRPLFYSFPVNSQCTQSLTAMACKQVFRGCYPNGLKTNTTYLPDVVSGQAPPPQLNRSTLVLSLPPLISTCEDWKLNCENAAIFDFARNEAEWGTTEADNLLRQSFQDLETKWFPPNCDQVQTYNEVKLLSNHSSGLFTGTRNFLGRTEYRPIKLHTAHALSTVQDRTIVGTLFPAAQQSEVVDYINYNPICPAPLIMPSEARNAMGQSTSVSVDLPQGLTIFGGACAIPCPQTDVIYTKYERQVIQVASDILVCIAMIFSGLLLLTMIVFASQRRKRILLKYVATYFCATVGMFIGMRVQSNGDTWHAQCVNEVEPEHMGGVSLFVSITVVYFLIASSLWWCMIALDLFSRLILARQYRHGTDQRSRRDLAMNLFCFGTPLLCVAALLTAGQLGPDFYMPISFITISFFAVSKPIELQWIFFFTPILAAAGVGLLLVVIVVVYLIQYQAPAGNPHELPQNATDSDVEAGQINTTTNAAEAAAKKGELVTVDKKHEEQTIKIVDRFSTNQALKFKIQQSLRMFGFVLLMVIFLILLIFNQADLMLNKDRWLKGVQTYAQCVVANGGSTCRITDKMSAGRVVVSMLALCSPGIIMWFLYFMFSTETYQLWARRIGRGLSITWLDRLGKDDYDTDGTDSSTDSSGSKGSKGSSDFFGGGDVVLNRKRKNHASDSVDGDQPTHSPPIRMQANRGVPNAGGDSIEMADFSGNPIYDSNPYGSNDPSMSYPQNKEAQKRRKTMFKGFKANKTPLSAAERALYMNEIKQQMNSGGGTMESINESRDVDGDDNEYNTDYTDGDDGNGRNNMLGGGTHDTTITSQNDRRGDDSTTEGGGKENSAYAPPSPSPQAGRRLLISQEEGVHKRKMSTTTSTSHNTNNNNTEIELTGYDTGYTPHPQQRAIGAPLGKLEEEEEPDLF